MAGLRRRARRAQRAALDRRRAPGGRARPADDRAGADAPAGDSARAVAARRRPAAAMRCSTRVGLADAADRRVGTYSGGMRRRLDLATALVHDPKVLFLDEPTTGLDPVSRIAIWDEVRRLNDEGTTVFLTTQYLEEADQLADRVGIIDEGKMAAEGTPAVLKAQIGQPAPRGRDRRGRLGAGRGDHWRASASRCRRSDGVLMVGLRARRLGRRADRARARRRRAVRRVARPGAADARRRVRREDGPPPRGRRGGATRAADEPVSGVTRRGARLRAPGLGADSRTRAASSRRSGGARSGRRSAARSSWRRSSSSRRCSSR